MTSRLPIPPYVFWLFFGLTPLWLPIAIVAGVPAYGARSLWRQYGPGPSTVNNPKPLRKPFRKRRRISNAAETTTLDSSCILWKLPIEIREMIWREVMTRHVDSSRGEPLRVNIRLRSNGKRLFSATDPRCCTTGLPNTALLRTNRTIYNEVSTLLYTTAHLTLPTANILISLVHLTPPSRLSQIRHLTFSITHTCFSSDIYRLRHQTWHARTWKRACRHLERFTGLHDLTVWLNVTALTNMHRNANPWLGLEEVRWRKAVLEPLLRPLAKVRVREGGRFVVVYPWPEGVCDVSPGGGSFELVQRARAVHYFEQRARQVETAVL